MAGLADWLEDYRNWRGRQEWEQGKGWQDFFGGDPRAQEQLEKLSGFGTDAGGLVGMIKASHGSPHAFTKFDFSKIGTGTGAQSYGYGGYFGQGFDSPVATGYRQIRDSANEYQNNLFLKQYHADNARLRGDKEGEERALAALAELKANPPGHLYNVEMKWPDVAKETADPFGEHHLLSWDEKFHQQPESVKNAVIKALHSDAYKASQVEPIAFNPSEEQSWLSDLFAKEKPGFMPSDYYDLHKNRTGEQIYQSLVERLGGEKEATALLREHGLPGIRYLDEASRTPGKGTSNYVIFDEQIPNIVSRNGVSLSDLLQNQQQLKSLNPTGSVFAGYNPTARASLPLGENLTTLSETMGVSPDELITIYRGVPHDVSTINPGDFITTNQQLAKDYAGTGKVISQKVKASDILDDLNESLGEEYIYRPGLKKLLKK